MDFLQIDEVNIDDNKLKPYIVTFQSGKLKNEESGKLRGGIFKNKKNVIVAVETKNILFTGKSETDDQSLTNALIIRNKKTGKTRLIGLDSAILAPNFNNNNKDILNETSNTSMLLNSTLNSTTNDLNKQFGSKRVKRRTEQQERMKMNVENVKEQLENTVANIEIDDADLFTSTVDDNVSLYRPPINRDASTKEEVYDLYNLVPKNVIESLTEEANNVLNSEEDFELSPFILSYINQLRQNVTEDAINRCKVLLYVHYLISYIGKPAKLLTKKFKICESSTDVNNHILDNFSVPTNTGRTRPFAMRDKAICYVLVLLMITLNYELNIEELAKDMKLGVKKIQDTCRILAFSSGGAKNKHIMTLKIPLPAPISLASRKRKK